MRVGIDASNLRTGGGVTHLVDLLQAVEPQAHGLEGVVVWGGHATLAALPPAPWLHLRHEPALDGGLLTRARWQRSVLAARLREAGCDILFAPGGTYGGHFRPFVTMSRNLLPFEATERGRYGLTAMRLKLAVLARTQAATLRRADGVIFLNAYARRAVERTTGRLTCAVREIPHGVAEAFRARPRPARPLAACSQADPFRLLYVSTIEPYKHQERVVEAVTQLRAAGMPVSLELVGGGREPWVTRLRETIARVDPAGQNIHYAGSVPHDVLPARYHAADAFVFASSCENMPNILLEAMASGLPIACAARGPMPDMLGDAGWYFDPERAGDIATALRALIDDPVTRDARAHAAWQRAAGYSWTRCAADTFALLREVRQAAGAR